MEVGEHDNIAEDRKPLFLLTITAASRDDFKVSPLPEDRQPFNNCVRGEIDTMVVYETLYLPIFSFTG